MQLYLIRHAHAGQRRHDGHDIYRPLSADGSIRADELAGVLGSLPITRVLSSPATRCVQTVEPLAAALGTSVDDREELWEGSNIDEVFALFDQLRADHRDVAACSHGDIIPEVIDRVSRNGGTVSGRGCELGSIWVLNFDKQRCQAARYLGRTPDTPT